ncbi:MAG: RagB/SusD family nutrient uptake outer membrane protein [Bacteroidales bacterium]|nr:RagB/SusD family nutrient uptake outer membrane protein [Bacteroidales bacterium]
MKLKISFILMLTALFFTGCNDVLDRPSLTTAEDDTYWTNEEKVRLYANSFYSYFFVGYGVGYDTTYAPNANYTFNDDAVRLSTQAQFTRSVPTSKGSTSLSVMWESDFTGPTWNFAWIRKANIMIDRIKSRMTRTLSSEQYSHWMGIGRFFRGLEYARLANVFGNIPYYNREISNTDLNELYKDRTPRNEVMDSVYNDFKYAMENVRVDDGAQNVNRYIVASFVSRWALYEASWQKYYYKDDTRAVKFYDLAVNAAEMVMNSGKYDIVTDFRTLFGSTDLTSNKDCILYRKYDATKGITHSIASSCNMFSPTDVGPNLDLIKSFICVDGKDWQTSSVTKANDFTLSNLIKTRDPRFEASFWSEPTPKSKSCYLYVTKFIPRSALNYLKDGTTPTAEFQSNKNVTGYPVMRYAEVLLNWIEAKAELATLGGSPIVQGDIDKSINKIRNRPLDSEAIAKGVQKTAPMDLSNLPDDPDRDTSVSPLIWEIRRERRMEFAFEYSRIIDLRRWKKLQYMDTDANKDLLVGTWVNFQSEVPDQLKAANIGKIRVIDANGNAIVYNGSNGSKMNGFFCPAENVGRLPFINIPNVNPYLSPIGTTQISTYKNKGYTLTQTEGWPSTTN